MPKHTEYFVLGFYRSFKSRNFPGWKEMRPSAQSKMQEVPAPAASASALCAQRTPRPRGRANSVRKG
eukprot:4572756-Pleurochrysis_carterae.AAC.1